MSPSSVAIIMEITQHTDYTFFFFLKSKRIIEIENHQVDNYNINLEDEQNVWTDNSQEMR